MYKRDLLIYKIIIGNMLKDIRSLILSRKSWRLRKNKGLRMRNIIRKKCFKFLANFNHFNTILNNRKSKRTP
jgi:hypothetical protein